MEMISRRINLNYGQYIIILCNSLLSFFFILVTFLLVYLPLTSISHNMIKNSKIQAQKQNTVNIKLTYKFLKIRFKKQALNHFHSSHSNTQQPQSMSDIPIACKFIYFVSFFLYAIGFFFTKVPLAIANYPELVYKNKQFYRLLVPFMSKGTSVFSIFGIIADIILIRYFFTKLELKHSTVYFIVEIFIQNLTFQIFFTIFSSPFIYANFLTSFLVSYGWTPLIVIFVFKYAFKDRSQKYKVFCLQFQKKYLAYIISFFSVIFAFDQFICIGLSIVFASLQFGLYGRHFISLPLEFYQTFESCIPQCIKSNPNFKKIEHCQSYIIGECWKTSKKRQGKQITIKEQVVDQKLTNITDPQKKVKKIRKTSGRNKNNKSGSGSLDFNDEAATGRSAKDMQEMVSQAPNANIETNNELHRDNKV